MVMQQVSRPQLKKYENKWFPEIVNYWSRQQALNLVRFVGDDYICWDLTIATDQVSWKWGTPTFQNKQKKSQHEPNDGRTDSFLYAAPRNLG